MDIQLKRGLLDVCVLAAKGMIALIVAAALVIGGAMLVASFLLFNCF